MRETTKRAWRDSNLLNFARFAPSFRASNLRAFSRLTVVRRKTAVAGFEPRSDVLASLRTTSLM
ncbi:hypothetical protein [Haloarcula marismortui]|uniref:Uncharacterized protein n=1 Tax=Haloarcula marismortui ATCC 33800 TaxID=662476 RepID=A0A8T8KCB0_9EURY|nr:hypothetical protein [Haloarcula sinaiiensis]QUJ70652.1 hypothetical protein KDQ40_07890 [Haloarcula sinaiiensis ATCC 33800]